MNNKITKLKNSTLVLLTSFNLFFPIFGIIFNMIYYLFIKLNSKEKRIIFFNIAFSMAFIAFLYVRTNETGDVYRYALSLYYYGESMLNGREYIIEGVYESMYPFWYFMLYLINKLNLNIQFLNMLAAFTIYSFFLYIIYDMDKKYSIRNVDKIIFIKIFLIFSFVAIYSSYKTLWAYSFLFLGLYLLFNNKKWGYIVLLFGIGIHPVAWIPLIAYLISKVIRFKKIYLYISIFIGVFFKFFISFFNVFLGIPFIGSKINTYIYGEWSLYRFQDAGEYVKVCVLICLILFVLYIILFNKFSIKSNDKFFSQYNNFILFYFSISLWFMSLRTIELRLIEDGVIFFLPLFYQVFMKRKIYKKNFLNLIILFIFWITIDIRLFNFSNPAYLIGNGFPSNIFSSPIVCILRDAL